MNTPGGFERMFELAPNMPEEAARALTAFGMDVVGPHPPCKRLPRRGIVSAILDDYRCSTSRLVTLRRCFWPPLCLEISPNRKAGIGQGAGGTPHANGETASTTSPPMRAVLLKRLKRLAEKFEPPNVGPRTAVRLPQRAACGYRKTGVSLRLTWRCRLRSLEIESRLNIGSVAVNALHPQMRARPSTILRI
jgi:hypothetical protein